MPYPYTYPFLYDPYQMNLTDSLTIADSPIKTVNLVKAETIGIIDSLSKSAHLVKAETLTITDSIVKTVNLIRSDTLAIVDSIKLKKWAYRTLTDFAGRVLKSFTGRSLFDDKNKHREL